MALILRARAFLDESLARARQAEKTLEGRGLLAAGRFIRNIWWKRSLHTRHPMGFGSPMAGSVMKATLIIIKK